MVAILQNNAKLIENYGKLGKNNRGQDKRKDNRLCESWMRGHPDRRLQLAMALEFSFYGLWYQIAAF